MKKTEIKRNKMMKLREQGHSLKNIGKLFGMTQQGVFYYIGRTEHLVIKIFSYKCQRKGCGKMFGYSAKKERKKPHKYCCIECSYIGRNKLGIPFKSGTREYERIKSAIYYKKNREKKLIIQRRYHKKHREERCRKMREFYYKNKLKK